LRSEISPKLRPLAVKSPVQSLDYRVNSYHIHLNTLGFHGCGKEISQICPCPFRPINTSFSDTPSPSCHSLAQNLLSWRRHYARTPRTSSKVFFIIPQVFNLHSCEEMAINFVVPEVSLPPFLLYFYRTPVHLQFILLNTPFFFYFFFLSSKTSRIYPIRSLFLPINPTSNVLVR